MFEIAICDDEDVFAKTLRKMVEIYMEKVHIDYKIDIYHSGKDLLLLGITLMKYKVIFLDINMEHMDGIETAKRIREMTEETFIVFVTAYINYALEGYSVEAIRYLLKSKDNLEEYVSECMDTIFHKMNVVTKIKEIQFNEGKKKVPVNRLLYIESKLHKLEYYIMENQLNVYTQYEVLNKIEDEYISYGFVRIHQSYLVNLKHVKSVEKEDGRYVAVLSNDSKLIIPKSRYQYVKQTFIEYKGEI